MSLRVNFSWTLVGNIVYAGCQWGMLAVIAKRSSPEMVGRFALGLAVTAPIMLLASLKLRSVQATDALGEYCFGHYLGLRLLTTPVALLAIIGLCLKAGYARQTFLTVMAVGLVKMFESISDVYHGYLQRYEQMDKIAISMMLKGMLSLVALSAGMYATGDVLWGAIGLAAVCGLVLVKYDIPIVATVARSTRKKGAEIPLRPVWAPRPLARLAWSTLPLGLVIMIGSLNTNIPRYSIERYLGERALGIFSAMAYLLVAGSLVINALGQSASPRLAQYFACGQRAAFQALLLKLVGLGVAIGLGSVMLVACAGRLLLTILYTVEYSYQPHVLLIMSVGCVVNYSVVFLGTAVMAMRRFAVQLPIHVVTSAVLFLVAPPLVHWRGLEGAAWALLIGALIEFAAYLLVITCAIGIRFAGVLGLESR